MPTDTVLHDLQSWSPLSARKRSPNWRTYVLQMEPREQGVSGSSRKMAEIWRCSSDQGGLDSVDSDFWNLREILILRIDRNILCHCGSGDPRIHDFRPLSTPARFGH